MKRPGEELVGHIGVDAGLVMVGDPCYACDTNSHPIHDWHAFCGMLEEWRKQHPGEPTRLSMNYALGHEGLGVVVDSGFGDGVYPVYATIKEMGQWGRRVVELRVDFDPSEDEEKEE